MSPIIVTPVDSGQGHRADLRALWRTRIRDEQSAVFDDSEFNTYLNNAVLAYSKYVPQEVKTTLALVANQVEYDIPSDLRSIVEIKYGDTAYPVADIFGGKLTLKLIPSESGNATFKYLASHTLFDADDSESTYDAIDEPLIMMHVLAQTYETLAGDAAKYYNYTEGDVTEDRGKTQKYYRDEADKLYTAFLVGVTASKSAQDERRTSDTDVSHSIAVVAPRLAPKVSKTIFKGYRR